MYNLWILCIRWIQNGKKILIDKRKTFTEIGYVHHAGGFALASMLLVAIGVWQFGGHERGNGMAQAMDDLELIASSDSLQLYEDLEFYQWLDVIEDNAG